jgi:hypothetical protein
MMTTEKFYLVIAVLNYPDGHKVERPIKLFDDYEEAHFYILQEMPPEDFCLIKTITPEQVKDVEKQIKEANT